MEVITLVYSKVAHKSTRSQSKLYFGPNPKAYLKLNPNPYSNPCPKFSSNTNSNPNLNPNEF